MGFVLCDLGKVRKKSEEFLIFFFSCRRTQIFIEVSPCRLAEKRLKNLQSPHIHFPGRFSNAEQETTETVVFGANEIQRLTQVRNRLSAHVCVLCCQRGEALRGFTSQVMNTLIKKTRLALGCPHCIISAEVPKSEKYLPSQGLLPH